MIAAARLSRRTLGLLLLAGLLARLPLLGHDGTPDVMSWKLWMFGAASDLTAVYGVGGHPPERHMIHWGDFVGGTGATDYPPLSLSEWAIAGRIYARFDPSFANGPALNAATKIPTLLIELTFLWAMLTWGRRVLGDGVAEWGALAFWLNPATWYCDAPLGYVDAAMALPAALAMLLLVDRRPLAAGVLAAAAVLTKLQPVFLAPVMIGVALGPSPRRWRTFGLAIAGAIGCAVLILLPFALRGALPNVINSVSRAMQQDALSAYGANVGWVGDWLLRFRMGIPDVGWHRALTLQNGVLNLQRLQELGYPHVRVIATTIVLVAVAWAGRRASRGVSAAGAFALAGWSVYAYVMFAATVHENHLYLALPLFAIAAAAAPSLRAPYWTVSAIFALNIYLFYGLGGTWAPLIDRRWTFIDLSVLLGVANIAAFVWTTRRVARLTAPPGARVTDSGRS